MFTKLARITLAIVVLITSFLFSATALAQSQTECPADPAQAFEMFAGRDIWVQVQGYPGGSCGWVFRDGGNAVSTIQVPEGFVYLDMMNIDETVIYAGPTTVASNYGEMWLGDKPEPQIGVTMPAGVTHNKEGIISFEANWGDSLLVYVTRQSGQMEDWDFQASTSCTQYPDSYNGMSWECPTGQELQLRILSSSDAVFDLEFLVVSSFYNGVIGYKKETMEIHGWIPPVPVGISFTTRPLEKGKVETISFFSGAEATSLIFTSAIPMGPLPAGCFGAPEGAHYIACLPGDYDIQINVPVNEVSTAYFSATARYGTEEYNVNYMVGLEGPTYFIFLPSITR